MRISNQVASEKLLSRTLIRNLIILALMCTGLSLFYFRGSFAQTYWITGTFGEVPCDKSVINGRASCEGGANCNNGKRMGLSGYSDYLCPGYVVRNTAKIHEPPEGAWMLSGRVEAFLEPGMSLAWAEAITRCDGFSDNEKHILGHCPGETSTGFLDYLGDIFSGGGDSGGDGGGGGDAGGGGAGGGWDDGGMTYCYQYCTQTASRSCEDENPYTGECTQWGAWEYYEPHCGYVECFGGP